MTSEEVSRRAAKRGDDFRPDPAVPTGSATPQDYTRSGYDRGHLAPAADMSFSAKAMSESFYMSNMSPQAPQFNRGIWSKLEKQVRHFATKEKRIVVVTGPILPAEKNITIGANKVTVPQYYYKVIYDTTRKDDWLRAAEQGEQRRPADLCGHCRPSGRSNWAGLLQLDSQRKAGAAGTNHRGGKLALDQVIRRYGKRRAWREQMVSPVTTTASGETSATVAAICPGNGKEKC